MENIAGEFVDWCEERGLNVQEALEILNAQDWHEDEAEYLTLSGVHTIHEDFV